MKKNVTIVGPANDAPVSTVLVLASEPSGTGDELATLVASFTTEYNHLDTEINDLTDELLGQEQKLAVRYRDELIPMLNRMQMLLSQRGKPSLTPVQVAEICKRVAAGEKKATLAAEFQVSRQTLYSTLA